MTDTALHRYQKAAGMEPGYYRAQVGLADCCLARNQIENAKELYLAVAEAMPSLKRVYIGLSLASTDHGDRDSYAVMSEEPGVRDH
ncbi:hypothetical protein BCR44DRAFT_1425130 [Catenaria anguillulae PL171]|uniref:Uncharacterized protein n=1 Tax=Catenaria anguillulae PL171 TaxID=765915 RepID=A0A1Y2I0T7_9FUNG|nr:hypothetical protein BCR44DRAFT_1425130 [Catenaria anguillulae PL171]